MNWWGGHKYVDGKCQRCGVDCSHEYANGGVYGKCKHCDVCNHERNGGGKGKCKHCGDCNHENANGGAYGKCKHCGDCNHEYEDSGRRGGRFGITRIFVCKHCGKESLNNF